MLQGTVVSLKLNGETDPAKVLDKICGLVGVTAINIIDRQNNRKMLFSLENLQEVLAGAPDALCLETVPEEQYREVVAGHTGHLAGMVGRLRDRLYVEYVDNLLPEVGAILEMLANTVCLLSCHVLQKADSPYAGVVRELRRIEGQLRLDGFVVRDNARCTDRLGFELLPQLRRISQGPGNL